jgi:hypothetical protein
MQAHGHEEGQVMGGVTILGPAYMEQVVGHAGNSSKTRARGKTSSRSEVDVKVDIKESGIWTSDKSDVRVSKDRCT